MIFFVGINTELLNKRIEEELTGFCFRSTDRRLMDCSLWSLLLTGESLCRVVSE